MAMAQDDYRALLVLAAGEERQHAGNDGYDDHPSTHYSWDSTVPNCGRIAAGDLIVLWDKQHLLGASVIESVSATPSRKRRHRCTKCGLASFKERKTKRPRYLCFKCGSEFDAQDSRDHDVTAIALNMAWRGQISTACWVAKS
jgi:ribosomal protein S27AE